MKWYWHRLLICVWSLLLTGGGLITHAVGAEATSAALPNVVVFLADDAGWGDYSVQGNQQLQTPHIDSLAKEGISLPQFFVCPVCSPTRAEFLTGRYHPRTGVYGVSTGQERMNPAETTIADDFRTAGYATGAFGKWHNGSQWPYHPLARGFQEFYGYTAGHWGEYFHPHLEHNGQPVRDEGYIVDLCTSRAIEFIERNRQQPFFCYVPFTTPHTPWAVPEEDWERFRDQPIMQTATNPEQEVSDHSRCAWAMLENQDRNVGRVLETLDQLQLTENTIVVYFSDNGPNSWRWNGNLKGRKGSTDEGGIRSVCFLRWPGTLPHGKQVLQLTSGLDLRPTLTALAGLQPTNKQPLDGMDFSPLLKISQSAAASPAHDAPKWTERMLFSRWGKKSSVRTPRYRLDHQGNLFDILTDPGQTTPVQKQHPQELTRLRQALRAWEQKMDQAIASVVGNRASGRQVDPRPLSIGYDEFPRTWLPARDGEPQGGIERSSSAPNSSFFVNWTSLDDALVWNVENVQAGTFAVEILYTCAAEDVGSTVELTFQEARLSGQVTPAWNPPLLDNQDTLPRPPAESPAKEFRTLSLGTVDLPAGQGPLTLKATHIPGREVMHLRAITLTLVKPEK